MGTSRNERERPPQCLATEDWLKKTFPSEPVESRADGCYAFRGALYRDGFRILQLRHDRIHPAFPLLHDILPFRLHGVGMFEDVEWYVHAGDIVRITDGPWKGLFGTVLDRLDGGVIIGDLCDSSFTPKELKGFAEDTDRSPSRVSDELHSI